MAGSPWTAGTAYEAYIGRWSRPVAAAFLRWLDLPAGGTWLDFGCGTGALSAAVLAHASPRLFLGCDRSPQYVGLAQATITDPRSHFHVAELPDLPTTPGGFDAVVSGLVLNFLPDPPDALRRFQRLLRPTGTVAAYVWDYAAGMQLLRTFWDAVTALDPSALALDEARLFPLCQPDPLVDLFQRAGLRSVKVTGLTVPTHVRSFEDYWTPFLGAQGPGGQYVAGLDKVSRARLEAHLRASLPFQADGSLDLTARAWAVQGVAT